jgi:hypothetical protein
MKQMLLGRVTAAVACAGMMLPPSVLAVEPAKSTVDSTNYIVDVALRPGGILVGQVVDQQGTTMAGKVVSIQYSNYEVARATSDANGVFAARGLRGGQYQLLTDDGISMCRLWAPNTAPPAARPAALLVSGNDVVRGQWGYASGPLHEWMCWMKAHPYITAGAVAAAIAIPLALADDDDDPPGS